MMQRVEPPASPVIDGHAPMNESASGVVAFRQTGQTWGVKRCRGAIHHASRVTPTRLAARRMNKARPMIRGKIHARIPSEQRNAHAFRYGGIHTSRRHGVPACSGGREAFAHRQSQTQASKPGESRCGGAARAQCFFFRAALNQSFCSVCG